MIGNKILAIWHKLRKALRERGNSKVYMSLDGKRGLGFVIHDMF